MGGFYDVKNLGNFSVNNPASLVNSKLQLLQSTISVPALPSVYDSSSGVTYDAKDLLNGYIVRQGITGDVTDTFDTATNIINLLRARYTAITNLSYAPTGAATLPAGISFECKLYNEVPVQEVNDWDLSFYSSLDLSVRIGGATNQIGGGATALLEIVVQDQAALGAGHIDQVFICISRCAVYIQLDNRQQIG